MENITYLILWGVVLVMPFWNIDQQKSTSGIDWEQAIHSWKMISPLLLLFLVNNYILLPLLLIRKKSWLYLLFVVCATALAVTASYQMHKEDVLAQRPPWEKERREQIQMERPPRPPEGRQRPNPLFPPFIVPHSLIALLIIGVNMGIKLLFKSIRDDHRMKSLEKQNSEAELAYLKLQINPHFFMNTLNNIHALIDIDKEKAQKTVLELSKIMRYVLYETSLPSVPLEKEIHFLANYIDLMKIRYTKQVDICVSLPDEIPHAQIPPLLFIFFLENAFKNGISYKHDSFIHFSMEIKGQELHCLTMNSCFGKEEGGSGMENIRKRLHLLYGTNYTLHTENKGGRYRVLLIIPVQL